MKTSFRLFVLMLMTLLFGACGVNNALIMNHNQNSTQVVLASNNYKVVDRVSGSASVNYIFFIGGMKKKQLYENAYGAMVNKANLMNGSRALVNIITEEHFGGVPPFFFKRTVTVTAHVVEFSR
jgi:hypothetical protein